MGAVFVISAAQTFPNEMVKKNQQNPGVKTIILDCFELKDFKIKWEKLQRCNDNESRSSVAVAHKKIVKLLSGFHI